MPQLSDLLEASFRGVRFLYKDGEQKFGRKTVSHEYPNQDTRYVEDLGLNDYKFSINATVASDNYSQNRDALKNALAQSGPGQLIHPVYGTVMVQVTSVVLNEDLKKYGDCEFKIEFEKTRATGLAPTGTVAGPSSLLLGARNIESSVSSWIAQEFKVSNIFPRNFTDAINLLSNVDSTMQNITSTLTTGGGLTNFSTALRAFGTNLIGLISAPARLGQTLSGLLDSFQLLQTDPSLQLNLNKQLYDFGDDDLLPPQTTAERIERVKNRNVINTAIQSMALANSYEAAANITFLDTSQLDQVKQTLDAQYAAVIEAPQISPDVQEQLETMRSTIRDLFANEEVNLYRISQVETHQLPVTVLAYQYYGDVDLVDLIISINNIDYPPAIEGAVQLFVR